MTNPFNLGVRKKNLTFTTEQQAIINSTEEAVLVNAVAGSGKTSVLMELAAKSQNGLYLAFNKDIVKDVIPKLPVGWSCKTFNGFGLQIIKKHKPAIKVNFNKYKQMFPHEPAADLAQKHMTMAGNATDESWRATCKRFSVTPSYIFKAKQILKAGLANTNSCSGDEMLEYPIINGWTSTYYDMVLVDECQDLNPQQIKFLSCIPTKRIIFVGDTHQAIYGFRGSDPEAIDILKDNYAPKEYPMNESFRCPTEVLDVVTKIVPQIRSRKCGGKVARANKASVNYPDDCFIISRTNANLIRLAHTFIHNGQRFSIGKNFVDSMRYGMEAALSKATTIDELRATLESEYETNLARYEQNGWNPGSMIDRYKGLITIAHRCASIKAVREFLADMDMHKDSSSKRKLMTIHAAKGLENDHVYFLDPDIGQYFKDRTLIEWEKQQEDNLYYVACTRALQTLTFVE